MKRYDSYKDSGIEWIGEIPSVWKFGKMKYQLSNNDGGVWGSDVENENDGTVVIRSTEITIDGQWDLSNPMKRLLTDSEIEKTLLYSGDIVLTKSSGSPNHIGKSVIVISEVENLKCCYSNFVQRLRFRNYNSKLYHYILNNHVVREQYRYLTQTTTGLGNLNGTTLNEVFLPFIPLSEQQQIVTFLDSKTSLIDSLIKNTQQKIVLLKEKRTSLINELVTKGMNPNVEMKDSGVEWIGEIPSHWEVKPLFTVSEHSKEKNQDGETTVLTLSYGKLKKRNVELNFGLLPESFESYQRVRPGYIILRLMDLQNDKKSLRIGHSFLDGIITSVYVGLKCKSNMLSEFLYYHLHNSDIKKVLYSLGGGLRQTLRFDELKRFPVPVFSIKEQEQIVKFLKEQTGLIDKTISIEEKRIELLKEYRQSLISEVVTGKRKVV